MNRREPGSGYITGTIEDCNVYLTGYEFAYNATRTDSAIFRNNYASNAQRGFNNDTPYNTFMSFHDNTFDLGSGKCYGMYLVNRTTWSRIFNNEVAVAGSDSSGLLVSGSFDEVLNGQTNHYSGSYYLLLDHNNIQTNSSSGNLFGFNLDSGGMSIPSHIDLENNTASSPLTNKVPSSVGYTAWNTRPSFPDSANSPNVGWAYSPGRADFGPDTHMDIVLQASNSNTRVWSMYQGSMLYDDSINPASAAGWRVAGTGDINLDGATDLFLEDDSTGYIGYWILDGTNRVAYGFLNPGYTPGWTIIAAADFNHDNKPDLLFEDANRQLAVWYMDGTNRTTAFILNPSGNGDPKWRCKATGDCNRDGSVDLIWQYDNEGGGGDSQLGVWYMRWGSTNETRIGFGPLDPMYPSDNDPQTYDPKWRVTATADFSYTPDNYQDVMFQYKNPRNGWGGALKLWYMSYSSVTNTSYRLSWQTVDNPGSQNVVAPR